MIERPISDARLLAAVVLSAAASTIAHAGPNAGANIELHLRHVNHRPQCPFVITCPGLVNEAPATYPAFTMVHVLVTDGNAAAGIAGAQFGIEYGSGREDLVGVDVYGWALCATLEFPQPSPVWPASGGGNLVTWDPVNACQTTVREGMGVVAIAGYFYVGVYGPATMNVTVRPIDGAAKVASCAAEEDLLDLQDLGYATFGLGPGTGYSPACDVVPTIRTTWSTVKSLYN